MYNVVVITKLLSYMWLILTYLSNQKDSFCDLSLSNIFQIDDSTSMSINN